MSSELGHRPLDLAGQEPPGSRDVGNQPTVHHEERHTPTTEQGFFRRNALGLACLGLFLVFWSGQAFTGWHVYNDEAELNGQSVISFAQYLTTGHFLEATFENWESEFLQMFAFILLTAYLVQRGSAESKKDHDDPHDEDPTDHRLDPDAPWPVRRGGAVGKLYEHSLLLAFVVLFLASIIGHAFAGLAEHNHEQFSQGQETVTLVEFITSGDFWFQSFQNWQSEFLAVFSIAMLTIVLREKRSPESKPVHAPHRATGEDG